MRRPPWEAVGPRGGGESRVFIGHLHLGLPRVCTVGTLTRVSGRGQVGGWMELLLFCRVGPEKHSPGGANPLGLDTLVQLSFEF